MTTNQEMVEKLRDCIAGLENLASWVQSNCRMKDGREVHFTKPLTLVQSVRVVLAKVESE